jgi:hypothetical protein
MNSIYFCKEGIKKKQYKYIVAVSFSIECVNVARFDISAGIIYCDNFQTSAFLQDVNIRTVYNKDTFFIVHKDTYKIEYNGEFNQAAPILDLCRKSYAEGRKKANERVICNTINKSGYNYSLVEDAKEEEIRFNRIKEEYKTLISKSLPLFLFDFNKNLISCSN